MKTWIKRTLIALFGAGVIAAGVAACGHRHHHGAYGGWNAEDVAKWRGRLLERAGSELTLDDAQKQRLGALFDKLDEQRQALRAGTPDPRAAFGELIAGEKFDRTKAAALVQQKTGAVQGKSPEVIGAAGDFYDSLKPEQQAKLRELLAKRWKRHGHG